jgi:type II secretory pathway pseudopilin PulG
VELLVVMGIIGLLIGLLMPAVNAAILAVRSAATRNIISAVETGLAASDHDDKTLEHEGSLDRSNPRDNAFPGRGRRRPACRATLRSMADVKMHCKNTFVM